MGSCPLSSQRRGFSAAKSSRVGRCQDHRKLLASLARGRMGSGRTVRTVNLRIAFTCVTLIDNMRGWNQLSVSFG
ncbi:hypothetical protein NicSoilB11_07650 [Arthrobacter sp. NicSoilB11]|nr:hypothetical protein StoSoilB19_07290 [Arthrobacter sp. StoSoilB19]BCW74440.1 hypothetical protein NicSoilB11_07650 [Arthrobacter sp. NicSoilB11]